MSQKLFNAYEPLKAVKKNKGPHNNKTKQNTIDTHATSERTGE